MLCPWSLRLALIRYHGGSDRYGFQLPVKLCWHGESTKRSCHGSGGTGEEIHGCGLEASPSQGDKPRGILSQNFNDIGSGEGKALSKSKRKKLLLAFRERERLGLPLSSKPIDWTAEEGTCGMFNHKAEISYDGGRYFGFQLQRGKPHQPTIQYELEKALCSVLREGRGTVMLQGAGRTDSGVHACRQVVNFYTNTGREGPQLQRALNAVLPDDIRVSLVARVPSDFNARFSPLSKTYHFYVHTAPIHDPFTYKYRQHSWYSYDLEAMRNAALNFLGTHDFTQFANVNPDGAVRDPNKTISAFAVLQLSDGLRFEVTGSGFLYKQVRHMVAALLQVGRAAMAADNIAHLLALGSSQARCAERQWTVADAKGLFLMDVQYPPHDNPDTLMYPLLPHDQYGRVWIEESGPFED
eukprot:jgi/Botrbrau1/1718/Bobra.116_2s0060.1